MVNMTLPDMLVKMMIVGIMSFMALASPPAPAAVVDLVPGSDQISGRLEIYRSYNGLTIVGTVSGLTPGKHGFHVHQKGDLGDGCKAAGGHFNPFNKNHGAPEDLERHAGDFGNVVADYQGVATIYIDDSQVSLDPSSEAYIGGLAIVVHAGVDDLGRGGNPESAKTGNAGARSGCGIIRVVAPTYQPPQSGYRPRRPQHPNRQPGFPQQFQYQRTYN
uniref:Superoxide dismutase [Cu-Zn] n=1 Tax=Pacifastacus leniusculus TaxID=6720 RepID=Q9XYS0_PACLE|nr:extracellular superoxide dismutase precursor [Pacifastacus leniusculus]